MSYVIHVQSSHVISFSRLKFTQRRPKTLLMYLVSKHIKNMFHEKFEFESDAAMFQLTKLVSKALSVLVNYRTVLTAGSGTSNIHHPQLASLVTVAGSIPTIS